LLSGCPGSSGLEVLLTQLFEQLECRHCTFRHGHSSLQARTFCHVRRVSHCLGIATTNRDCPQFQDSIMHCVLQSQ
jgi:hypothetical protein